MCVDLSALWATMPLAAVPRIMVEELWLNQWETPIASADIRQAESWGVYQDACRRRNGISSFPAVHESALFWWGLITR